MGIHETEINGSRFNPLGNQRVIALMDKKVDVRIDLFKLFDEIGHPMGGNTRQGPHADRTAFKT